MTSRDRVLMTLNHEQPARPPRLLYEEVIGYTPPIQKLLAEKCAPQSPGEYFRMDIAGLRLNPTRLARRRFEPWLGTSAEAALASGQVDEWGVWWRQGGLYHFAHIESPLREVEDFGRIKEYPWPDLDQDYRFAGIADQVNRLHALGLAVAAVPCQVFEQAWYIRGMERLLVDMMTEPEHARYLLERAADLQRTMAERFARAGADIIITGDDVAGQTGLLLGIDLWREYLKPLQAATVRAVKRANPESRVFFHSDGNIAPLIPDLIETGIDILNPLQPECVDPAEVKRRYGDRLSFWGAVSVQRTMSSGTPEQVRAEVRQRIATVGHGGGYILAPAHVLSPETPWENIVAFFEAADQSG